MFASLLHALPTHPCVVVSRWSEPFSLSQAALVASACAAHAGDARLRLVYGEMMRALGQVETFPLSGSLAFSSDRRISFPFLPFLNKHTQPAAESERHVMVHDVFPRE